MASSIDIFPLQSVMSEDLQRLGQCLWEWQLCGDCLGRRVCDKSSCPWSRAERLNTMWTRYRELTAAYVPEFYARRPAVQSHAELLAIIHYLKSRPDKTRETLVEQHFLGINGPADVPASSDQNRAFNLAASVLLLFNCGAAHERTGLYEEDVLQFPWRDAVSLNTLVRQAFPRNSSASFDTNKVRPDWTEVIFSLAVVRWDKTASLRIEPTNDLRSHLTLNLRTRIVQIYHSTSILKEIISASKVNSEACVIPRALACEVLKTIHHILFAPDHNSQVLLSSLVSRRNFDKDLLSYKSSGVEGDEDFLSYPYFGARLAELYDELQNPTPRTRLESWFERRSGARYMLMATMIGVFIAVILGFLSLGVAMFQAWVAYQQWKHPVKEV